MGRETLKGTFDGYHFLQIDVVSALSKCLKSPHKHNLVVGNAKSSTPPKIGRIRVKRGQGRRVAKMPQGHGRRMRTQILPKLQIVDG